VKIKVTAVFNNGEKAEKETDFIYNTRAAMVDLNENWDNLSGNAQHTGVGSPALTPPLQMSWTSNVGSNIHMASPVIHRGVIYVASADEDLKGKGYIYSLDSRTGNLLWKYPVNNSIKNTIAVEDSAVYAQTAEGSLYAIKTVDGSLKWGTQLHVNNLPALTEGLAIADGVLYAGTGSGLCALDARNGRVLWENKGWQQGEGASSTLTVGNNILVGSSQWRGLYGNDAATGELKWHLNKNGITNRGASPAMHNGLLYVTAAKSLFIIDAATGNVIVRKEYPFSLDVTSTPLLTDNSIVFGSADSGLIAVDRETLEIKWQFAVDDALVYTAPYTRKVSKTVETSPVLSGNAIYFGASDGNLYGLNKDSGELLWKHRTGAPVLASVALSGNTLVAVDFGGNVYAFTAKQ
jgi:outer membrane protein assembly factor BamB